MVGFACIASFHFRLNPGVLDQTFLTAAAVDSFSFQGLAKMIPLSDDFTTHEKIVWQILSFKLLLLEVQFATPAL